MIRAVVVALTPTPTPTLLRTPSASPSPSINVHLVGGGSHLPSWVVPVAIAFVAQAVTNFLFWITRRKTNEERFFIVLRDVCGKYSGAAIRLHRGHGDYQAIFDDLQAAWAEVEYVATEHIWVAGSTLFAMA